MLHAIEKGVALGAAKQLPSKDPFTCRNSHMSDPERQALQRGGARAEGPSQDWSIFESPFIGFQYSPLNVIPKCFGAPTIFLIHLEATH